MTEAALSDEHTTAPPGALASHSTIRLVAVLAVAVAAALGAGVLLGSAISRPAAPSVAAEGSVSAGFARDMAAHHAQAVQLSALLRDRSQDTDMRLLSLDILTTQQEQIGQMNAWLDVWGLPRARQGEPMAWMDGADTHGHDSAHGSAATEPDELVGLEAMPGWVLPAEMARLTDATGIEAERLYLTLMIEHHEGGVAMAQYAADHADQEVVVRLARGIVRAQSAELALLHDLLDARGGALT